MEERKTNKKKLVVALAILALIVVASVITTVVLVLAANQQNVNSNVNITYSVTDVSAKVTGKYGRRVAGATTVILSDMGTVEFTPSNEESTETMTPSSLSLSSSQDFVVFEYKIENTSDTRSFTIALNYTDTNSDDTNFTVKYTSSETEISNFDSTELADWTDTFTSKTLSGAETVYVYVYAKVTNTSNAATLTGTFGFTLNSNDAS